MHVLVHYCLRKLSLKQYLHHCRLLMLCCKASCFVCDPHQKISSLCLNAREDCQEILIQLRYIPFIVNKMFLNLLSSSFTWYIFIWLRKSIIFFISFMSNTIYRDVCNVTNASASFFKILKLVLTSANSVLIFVPLITVSCNAVTLLLKRWYLGFSA